MKIYRLLLLALSLSTTMLLAQQAPFSKGVNLTEWFQASSAQQIQFSRYTQKDFEQIKSLGCDVIRLPINLHFMTSGAPDYELDPLFLFFLDQAVDWAEETEINLILDNHTFDPAVSTDPNIGIILEKVWRQMATHFQSRSTLLFYEVLNEPHGISDVLWNEIQQEVVKTIREVDDEHTIVIGGADWNSFNNLAAMPVYEDDNLIYTFHFYDPFLFTHQGASWVAPSMVPLANLPYPFDAAEMPELPASMEGSWQESLYNNYNNDGRAEAIRELIDIAVDFREERNVPIFCGEFGVYIPNSPPEDRVEWYRDVRSYLDEKEIAWTSWDYHGGFGLFNAGSNALFDHDLNIALLEAMGLNTPPQSPFELRPDSSGFFVYRDFIETGIRDASFSNGPLQFYNDQSANYGQYCIYWTDAVQYNGINFDFAPNRDLSYLVNQDFALDLFVRWDQTGQRFDIRFVDTKENASDRPWRIRLTIDENEVPADNEWHHLHLPLSDFVEHGSWDDNTWHEPQGLFDWSAIDRLEVVAEHGSFTIAVS